MHVKSSRSHHSVVLEELFYCMTSMSCATTSVYNVQLTGAVVLFCGSQHLPYASLKFCLYARTDMQTSILASLVVCRQELLRGPLFYVLIMTAVTVVFWRDSPVGMMVLSLMCGGDGLADIIGRRYGTAKLPFNKAKSWAGSLAMFTGKFQFCS